MSVTLATSSILRESASKQSLAEAHPDTGRRPRELFLARGREAMRDEDLLAIILRTGTRGCNVLELSSMLLRHYGTLRELGKATVEELIAAKFPGLNKVKAIEIASVLELARRIAEETELGDKPLAEPAHIVRIVTPYLLDACQEYLFVFPLDRRCRLIGRRPILISQGLADATLIHPREVFRSCIRLSAVHAIIAHNHPSGDPAPSAEDIRSTRQLIEAGKIIDIRLLDHVIIGAPHVQPYASLRERNILSFEEIKER